MKNPQPEVSIAFKSNTLQAIAWPFRSAWLVLVFPILFLSGCASVQPTTKLLEPVGPAPIVKRAHAPGYLVVYTAVIEPGISSDTLFYPHTAYAIYDARGRFFQTVRNHVGAWDESPFTVNLPPGHYTVNAQSKFDGDVAVPVIIEMGRTTVVDLQHRDRPLARSERFSSPSQAALGPG
jgi:hypothetical protein